MISFTTHDLLTFIKTSGWSSVFTVISAVSVTAVTTPIYPVILIIAVRLLSSARLSPGG